MAERHCSSPGSRSPSQGTRAAPAAVAAAPTREVASSRTRGLNWPDMARTALHKLFIQAGLLLTPFCSVLALTHLVMIVSRCGPSLLSRLWQNVSREMRVLVTVLGVEAGSRLARPVSRAPSSSGSRAGAAAVTSVELATKVRKDFTITEMAQVSCLLTVLWRLFIIVSEM